MTDMTNAVETQQQQQYSSTNAEHHCSDCGLTFESEKSLEVHLRYHQKNLLDQWTNKPQEESNNNHSKTGNHNSHVNRDNVIAPTESSEPSSMSPSQDPTSSQQQQQQQQQQQPQSQQTPQQQQSNIHTIVCQPYDNFQTNVPIYNETGYFIQNDQSYPMLSHFSPSQEDAHGRDSGGSYTRYHPYSHLQQHFHPERATSNSTSPQSSPFQCDKCGAVYEDANQLGEHVRTNHLESPTAFPSGPQYQQLGNSPQQQGAQQLHPSSPHNQPQQQSGYDYNGGQATKLDMKQEPPEEQAEILDLDSHKVHRHEELIRLQQQQQQSIQIQMHHHQVMQQQHQQQQRSHSVSAMLNWAAGAQAHDYHTGLPPMPPIDNVPPIADQNQFMRGQHMPVEHGHQGSSLITNTQPIPGHQIPTGFAQQPSKVQPCANQSWKSNEPRRPKTYNCTACNKWFTSSGHLKRHYNTTLHKNAVKNGKEPDPATMPISAHHHPARDNNGPSTGSRGGANSRSSPSLPSSRSPPNLMAGPSGEATRGLLHTPTTPCNNSSNSSNSSNDSSGVALSQQQQQIVHLPHSGIMPLNSPVPSPLAGHHQQQMGSAPHQLGLQQSQQQLHLQAGSSGQPVHHTTTSPMPPPPAASHMNCPSPMDTSPHPHHHMSSPSGSVMPAMTSPTSMGGTTMPHQPYPNALPPHVTTTTSTPVLLLEPTPAVTMQLTTIGNEQNEQQQQRSDMLPGFGTIDQRFLPSFTEFGVTGFVVNQSQIQAVNVGGLSVEESSPQESFESSASTYDPFSPSRYKSLANMSGATVHTNENIANEEDEEDSLSYQLEQTSIDEETNNNNLLLLAMNRKEDVDPNILLPKKGRKSKASANKERQITTGANFISQNGFHKCIDCNKNFNKACYLTQHNKSFHSGDKPFKCAQCGKRFQDEERHEKHVQMHSQAKRHQCEVCPKKFAHKTDLKRHICIHTGKRPFKCDICGKGFIRQDHMMKHTETHKKKARIQAQRQQIQRIGARYSSQRVNVQRYNFQAYLIKST